MSASREKKQRQDGNSANKGMSAQQQAAQTKRKTIQYTVIGVVCAILVVALLVWDSGMIQRGMTAVTIGNTNYSVGEMSWYYYQTYQNEAVMAQYGMSSYDTTLSPEDQVYSSDEETGTTVTYADHFRQSAIDVMTETTALYEAAIADGYKEADVKNTVDSQIENLTSTATSSGYSSLKQYLYANYTKNVNEATVRSVMTKSALASQYETDHNEGLQYSDEELNTYYEEHAAELDSFKYSYLYFPAENVETTDAEGNDRSEEDIAADTDRVMAAAKVTADEARDAILSGTPVSQVVEDMSPSSSAVEEDNYGERISGVYSEWLKDDSRENGDVGVIENSSSGYYVAVLHDRYLDETPSVDVRHILIRAETPEDDPETTDVDESAGAPSEEQMAAAKSEAEDILAQWQSGEATEESFAALAEEHSGDGRDESGNLSAPGGLYEAVYPGEFVGNFSHWIFDEPHQPGDTGIVENAAADGTSYYGYHITYFVKENPGDFRWKNTARTNLANADTTEWTESLKEGVSATEQSAMKYVG